VIRAATANDAETLARIYNHYVLNTAVTFEEEAVSAQQMAQRNAEVNSAGFPWLVAQQQGQVLGYAYVTKWRERSAYRFSAHSSVYLEQGAVGQGLGSELYQALMAILKQQGLHLLIGGITLPNPASVALHEKFGFKKVAHFEEVGFKFKQWRDVGYWQVVL
jgi:L-amino acid N-acyltransferase YncA